MAVSPAPARHALEQPAVPGRKFEPEAVELAASRVSLQL